MGAGMGYLLAISKTRPLVGEPAAFASVMPIGFGNYSGQFIRIVAGWIFGIDHIRQDANGRVPPRLRDLD